MAAVGAEEAAEAVCDSCSPFRAWSSKRTPTAVPSPTTNSPGSCMDSPDAPGTLPPSALLPLGLVLDLRIVHGLPLHVVRRISATSVRSLHVVDGAARARPAVGAGVRAGRGALELSASGGAARNGERPIGTTRGNRRGNKPQRPSKAINADKHLGRFFNPRPGPGRRGSSPHTLVSSHGQPGWSRRPHRRRPAQ